MGGGIVRPPYRIRRRDAPSILGKLLPGWRADFARRRRADAGVRILRYQDRHRVVRLAVGRIGKQEGESILGGLEGNDVAPAALDDARAGDVRVFEIRPGVGSRVEIRPRLPAKDHVLRRLPLLVRPGDDAGLEVELLAAVDASGDGDQGVAGLGLVGLRKGGADRGDEREEDRCGELGAIHGVSRGLLDGGLGRDVVFLDDVSDYGLGEFVPGEEREALPPHDPGRIDEEHMGDAGNVDFVVHFLPAVDGEGIERFRVVEILDLLFRLVADADDHELVLEFLLERIEFGNCLAAGRAPGGPEVDEDEFSRRVRFVGDPFFDPEARGFLVDDRIGPHLLVLGKCRGQGRCENRRDENGEQEFHGKRFSGFSSAS